MKECSRRLWERIFAGGGGKGGWGGEHANHRCVQVDEEGGPGNNFLGHEILFYGGEILPGRPVKKHLFKSVCTYSQEIPRGGDVSFVRQKEGSGGINNHGWGVGRGEGNRVSSEFVS